MAGLLSVATVWLLAQFIQAHPHVGQHPHRTRSLVRRDFDPEDCKLWIPTNVWTTCQSLIDHYNITLPDFVQMNPSVEFDCYYFEPGENYCLRMPSNYPISTDGSCGVQAPTKVTCIGSKFGDCCGKTGQLVTPLAT
ncbi:hypothetical protein FQN57_000905 [Myotisia sp. PD_48]|nr:hypothetical protein FQN57_000905 [Myotisia sp. PD_48]